MTDCDVVDMEAYFIVQVAHKLKIPIVILKQVTDHANHQAEQQIEQNMGIWQESLRQGLAKILNI
jgi:nucleoside phosphorylase